MNEQYRIKIKNIIFQTLFIDSNAFDLISEVGTDICSKIFSKLKYPFLTNKEFVKNNDVLDYKQYEMICIKLSDFNLMANKYSTIMNCFTFLYR
jgi:hypothetical protein